MIKFASTVFDLLRRMDAEATVRADGSPTGLSWYGGHYKPEQKRPRTEVAWSKRLAELLPQHGYPTRAEVPYPASPKCRCDDVIVLPDGKKLWLEVKGAWKQYWLDQGGSWIYRSYLLHPLLPGLDASKTHTVPLDLRKLDPLRPPDADRVAILLIGFDRSDNHMDGDVAELVRMACLDGEPWEGAEDRWPDPYRPGFNVRCWLWHRSTARASGRGRENPSLRRRRRRQCDLPRYFQRKAAILRRDWRNGYGRE